MVNVLSRRFAAALLYGLAETAVALSLAAALHAPANAQVFDDRFPFIEERVRRGGPSRDRERDSGFPGFFQDSPRRGEGESNVKAPAPQRKSDSAPLTSVVVVGDSMADWLAYGLEQAASESPDIGILRRHRTNSGLIRVETRNDPRGEYPDWPQAAREILNAEKANFIVMMIGLNDRRSIRERAPARPAPAPGAAQTAAPAGPAATPAAPAPPSAAPKPAETPDDEKAPAEAPAAVAEPDTATTPGMLTHEFRSDKWTELYIKRIDDTIAALKAKNVPVFWVGLPPVRGTKSATDISFLNDLYRSRAEKAGITYIDTWDGFVDESGRYVVSGPDFEGQIRRLRSSDGVHFTTAGARKLAHYVEREIQRTLVTKATPVALPIPDEPAPQTPVARPGSAAVARPLAGPVVPLTAAAEADELLGGANTRQPPTDALASRVLVRGEPVAAPQGRSDDFAWPRRGVAPVGTDPVVATTTMPTTPMQERQQTAAAAAGPAAAPARAPGASRHAPRPPGPVAQARTERRFYEPQRQFFFPFFGR